MVYNVFSLLLLVAADKEIVWMQPPPEAEAGSGCPPGLEYLTQIDQLIVAQQMELVEGEPITR